MNSNIFNIKIDQKDNNYCINFVKNNNFYKLFLTKELNNDSLYFNNVNAEKLENFFVSAEYLKSNDGWQRIYIEDCNLQFNIIANRNKNYSLYLGLSEGRTEQNESLRGELYPSYDQDNHIIR